MRCPDLIALVDAVDRTTARIAAAAISASSSAANDLVRARRILSTQALELSRAIDDNLVNGLARLGTPEADQLRTAYLDRRNSARTAIADHQAKWPAVEMRKAIEHYRADVGRLHVDQQSYRAWLRTEFIPSAAAMLRL